MALNFKTFVKVVVPAAMLATVVFWGCVDNDDGDDAIGNEDPTPVTYTLTTNVSPIAGGTVSPAGTSTHSERTTITITAHAANGYVFANWTGAGVANPNNMTTTVTMSENRSVIANFTLQTAPPPPAWDGMSCNDSGVCIEITNETAWDRCPVTGRFPTESCTPESSCEEGVDCDSDEGRCTIDGVCANDVRRGNCKKDGGTFVFDENCPALTFYCPTACVADTGASRPASCFETQSACEASVTPSCIPWQGNGCPTDEGYCNNDCTLVERSTCSGTLNPTRPVSCDFNTFTDSRDGKVYRSVLMPDGKTWMAENLNFETSAGSWCYKDDDHDDEEYNCEIYGRLYDWSTAMGFESDCNSVSCADQIQTAHRGICPNGWRLPSNAEWGGMVAAVEPSCTPTTIWCEGAGTKLKSSTNWDYWEDIPYGTDDFGFSALPGGQRQNDSFAHLGMVGLWWTATEYSATSARNRDIGYGDEGVDSDFGSKTGGFSVRCVRD